MLPCAGSAGVAAHHCLFLEGTLTSRPGGLLRGSGGLAKCSLRDPEPLISAENLAPCPWDLLLVTVVGASPLCPNSTWPLSADLTSSATCQQALVLKDPRKESGEQSQDSCPHPSPAPYLRPFPGHQLGGKSAQWVSGFLALCYVRAAWKQMAI